MLSLSAIEPDGLVILDRYGVGEELVRRSGGSVGGHEAGEESICLVGHDVLDGYARVIECGLSDGMVLWVELELDEISRRGLDVIRDKGKRSVGSADLDNVYCDHALCGTCSTRTS